MVVVLAAALTQWPYPRSCGMPLYGYLAVVLLVSALAVRATVISWTDHRAVAHWFAIAMLLGGIVFAAEAVLPRVGYAKNAASFSCGADEAQLAGPSAAAALSDSMWVVPE